MPCPVRSGAAAWAGDNPDQASQPRARRAAASIGSHGVPQRTPSKAAACASFSNAQVARSDAAIDARCLEPGVALVAADRRSDWAGLIAAGVAAVAGQRHQPGIDRLRRRAGWLPSRGRTHCRDRPGRRPRRRGKIPSRSSRRDVHCNRGRARVFPRGSAMPHVQGACATALVFRPGFLRRSPHRDREHDRLRWGRVAYFPIAVSFVIIVYDIRHQALGLR